MLRLLAPALGALRPARSLLTAAVPRASFARKLPRPDPAAVAAYKRPIKTPSETEVFQEEDVRLIKKYAENKYRYSKLYHKLQSVWQNRLVSKAKRRERLLAAAATRGPAIAEPPKLIVHSPLFTEITLNEQTRYDSFAVISLNGCQHKVTPDDLLVVNRLPGFKVGDVVAVDQVHLIGTKYFTILGRPTVDDSKVFLSVEQQCLASKVIVFKKKRRKGYRRSRGHRQPLTVLRVHRIEYGIGEELARGAVKVWDN